MFKALWSAVLGGNPTSWIAMGLGALLALGAAFGAGYYECSRVSAGAAATAAQAASVAAQKAQAAKDAADYAATKKDMASRAAAATAADVVYQTIYRDRLKLVPMPASGQPCVVPKAAMAKLNDPTLVSTGAAQ